MQSLNGPRTRTGRDYKSPSVVSAFMIVDGERTEFPHVKLEIERNQDHLPVLVWRAYSLHPGKKQGQKARLEASAHMKVTRDDLIAASDRMPFFTMECEEIHVGSSIVSGTIGLVLEDKTIPKL